MGKPEIIKNLIFRVQLIKDFKMWVDIFSYALNNPPENESRCVITPSGVNVEDASPIGRCYHNPEKLCLKSCTCYLEGPAVGNKPTCTCVIWEENNGES